MPGLSRGQAAVLMLQFAALQATAGDWQFEPTIALGGSYNDNPALEPEENLQDADRVTGSLLAAFDADITKEEPNSSIVIEPRIRHIYYPDRDFSRLDRTDYFLRGNINNNQQLLTSSLGFSYDYQGILSAEDFSDTGDGSGNFDRPDDKRQRYSLSPSFNWTPTPVDTLGLSATVNRIDHDLDFTGRSDIDSYNLGFRYNRAFTERQSIGAIATYADSEAERLDFSFACSDGASLPDFEQPDYCFDVDPDNPIPPEFYPFELEEATFINETTTESFSIAYQFQWSPQTSISASYGNQKTDSSTSRRLTTGGNEISLDNSFESSQYTLNISQRGERSRLNVDISQGVSFQSDGVPSDNLQVGVTFNYRLTEKLTGEIAGIGSERETRGNDFIQTSRFFRADAKLSWRFNDNLSLVGQYIYRNRDPNSVSRDDTTVDQSVNATRTSNQFIGSVRYRF